MFTPATTASSVSAPARIISIAFAVALNPFALETTRGREPLDCAKPVTDESLIKPAATPATALVRTKSLRVTLVFM
jgi:hypothetical protein